MRYVTCPETITSPAPSPEFMEATGLGPNEPCGLKCEIITPGDLMVFKCARGHSFIATEKDILDA